MKTMLLLFSTPLGYEENIPEIKKSVVQYVGSRLVQENPDNAPLIQLNASLGSTDMQEISIIVRNILETAAIFVIEADDEKFGRIDGNMCVLQPVS